MVHLTVISLVDDNELSKVLNQFSGIFGASLTSHMPFENEINFQNDQLQEKKSNYFPSIAK
jgi:hypothetical protein